MAKKKQGDSGLWKELLKFGLYKRNQGRLTRQLTAVGFGLMVFFAAWTLSQGPLLGNPSSIRIGIPVAITVIGAWVIFRAVNVPRFADFLISVEAEMDKVSWASKAELYRSTIVVIYTMVFLAAVLFVYDRVWQSLFLWLGILKF